MNRQASLFRIVAVDYGALISVIAPVAIWGVVLFIALFQGSDRVGDVSLYIAIGITVVSVASLLWRIQLIRGVVNDGLEVPAVISSLAYFRDRGRVEYVYTHQGKRYQSGNAIHRSPLTSRLRQGDSMILVVDRDRPERAFIRDLYVGRRDGD